MMNQVEIFEDFPYVILELLGTGSYAKVYRAKSANDPLQEAAVKVFSKRELTKMRKMIMGDDGLPEWVDGMEDLKNEVCILEYIAQIEDSRKKYLQKYLQYFDDISPDLVFLILEKYENGVLMEWNEFEANYSFKLRDKDSSSIWTMPPLFARKYIKQISLGISLLKEIGISHRDIKPENVLLDSNLDAHVIDYSASTRFKDASSSLVTGSIGSLAFSSPESLSGEEYDAYQSDVWSIGIMMFCMIFGKLPFESMGDFVESISQLSLTRNVEYWKEDPGFYELMERALCKDPLSRLSISELSENISIL